MIQLRNYSQLTPIVSGYELDDQFSVVVPIARTNIVSNPSFETNTASWTAIGGSIARTTTQQYHGAFSLAITPTAATTDGARFDTVSLTAGQLYAYSAKVLGQAGRSYKLAIETTGAVELTSVVFTATGRWQWIVGYYAEVSTTTRRLTVRKDGGTDVLLFYLDGAQVEAINAGETASTFIDGSQQGLVPNQQPPAYFWNGTPHASTSARSGLTRAGGMVIPFKQFGFLLAAIIGLGLAPPQNVATEYARIDGGYDDYTRKPTRQFTLSGQFQGDVDYLSLRQRRGGLSRLLDRDLVAQDQRLVLLRNVVDACGEIVSSTCRVLGKYQGGLEGNTDNHVASVAPITFTQYLGVVLSDGESGGTLGVQTSVPNTASVAERLPNGTWRAIASTFNNAVNALLYTSNSRLVIGGAFTAPQTRVASWDGTTLSAMGAGLGTAVQTLVESPDGTVYAGLDTTVTIGGVTGSVVQFTAGAWAVVGATGTMTDNVQQMVWAKNGNLYAVGNSTISRATLARWNGTAWSNLFTHSAGSTFFSVVEGFDGLYIGGVFTNLNADANQDGIVKYSITGAAFSAMSTGLAGGGIDNEGLAVGNDGRIYLTGSFTSAGGITANHAAVWNGVTFASLGSGLTAMTAGVMRTLPNGTILTGGDFSTANGITFPDPLAIWTGGAWIPLDANLPTGSGIAIPVLSIDTAIDGRLAVGYNDAGSSTSAATTTITNPGTARSYPTLTLTGPTSGSSRIWQCVNITTNKAIYFNYTMLPGEVATLIFTPDNLSFTSTFAGNISSTIMAGSNTAEFYLQPGANIISFFSADTTVTAVLFFRPAYVSLDDIP